jgi:hypothetical protein
MLETENEMQKVALQQQKTDAEQNAVNAAGGAEALAKINDF